MQLPEPLPAFLHKTLLVITDHTQAKFFVCLERTIEPAHELVIDYPPKADMERYSMKTPSGMHAGEQSEQLDREGRKRLFHALNQELVHRLHIHQFDELIIAAPKEHLNELVESLHHDLQTCIKKTIPKLLTKESLPKILEHVFS